MKRVSLALALVCGMALAIPSKTIGAGLGGCDDCAAQRVVPSYKGGYVVQKVGMVQKGDIVQKGEPIQKRGVIQKGGIAQHSAVIQKGSLLHGGGISPKGGVVQKGGEACGGCGSCCLCVPNVIPALLRGIDCLLSKVFCCHCDPCRHYGKGMDCGSAQKDCCDGGYDFMPSSPRSGTPSDPFIDDLQAPPISGAALPGRGYRVRTTLYSTGSAAPANRVASTPRPAVPSAADRTAAAADRARTDRAQADRSEPDRTASAGATRVAPRLLEETAAPALKARVIHVSSDDEAPSGQRIPKNPLRGE